MSLCDYIERKFGWNKKSEKFNALLTALLHPILFFSVWGRILRAFILKKRVVIFSFSMPGYADNVQNVPILLQAMADIEVIIFNEWDTFKHKDYILDEKYKKIPTYDNVWRFMPLVFGHVHVTPIARKHVYFPMMSRKVFCFHSLASIQAFSGDAFLSYDFFLSAGDHQTIELLDYFSQKKLSKKTVIKAGYPKVDAAFRYYSSMRQEASNRNGRVTVLYAPTYFKENADEEATLCSTIPESLEIISTLLKRFDVIFRPHPLNLKHGNIQSVLKVIEDSFTNCGHFYFDKSKSSTEASLRADIMLSDASGTAFTFALAFNKPVVFLDKGVSGIGIHFQKRESIGSVIHIDKINNLCEVIDAEISPKEMVIKRDELVYNFLQSEKEFVENIYRISKDLTSDEWLVVDV